MHTFCIFALYMLNNKENELIRVIRNYLVTKGRTPTIRELKTEMGYKSPRSVSILVNQLADKKYLSKKSNGRLEFIHQFEEQDGRGTTVDVPMLGSISCGLPILAIENVEAIIPVSTIIAKPPNQYFILKAFGDSMNEKNINDGDLVLIKQQQVAANGDLVVALIDDTATIKEIRYNQSTIVLLPCSTNRKHQPIVLTTDFKVQGVVVKVILSKGEYQ
jgi:repressor LexA